MIAFEQTKGPTWVKMADSALTKTWALENDFQRGVDPSAREEMRLLLLVNDLMDIAHSCGQRIT